MSEETSDEQSDDSVPQKPVRGTASRPSPFAGESAPPQPDEDATVTITAPDGSVREYRLTDGVKAGYEEMVQSQIDNACHWYEMWWDGTSLVIEYEGFIRDEAVRPEVEELSQGEIQQMMRNGQQPKMDGIPKRHNPGQSSPQPHPAQMGGMAEPSIAIDASQEDREAEHFDEGVVPVWNKTAIDVQRRANDNPLQVEDLFIRPWDDEAGQEPVNSEHEDGEVDEEMFELDFREHTDGEQTVREGARGDRWDM